MDVRLLGPFEVVGEQGTVVVRGAKRRGLLALLLVHSGQRVGVEQIVEALWGEADAPGAARTVQSYVSQLRRALDAPGVAIVSSRVGYTLELPPGALDTARFEARLRAAGEVADPSERLRRLDEALALWRGEPLEEFADDEWARPERARLELLRLQALEQQVEARLVLGRHRELIGELEGLVDAHPLDERLWGHLLLAYYRSGRQADALRAYQRLRVTLAEELGIEPSPDLVALERRILDQDDSLLAPAVERGPVSALLPSGTVTFLFTDLGDSTRLWETHTEEMRRVIARHHELTRDVIEAHGGQVVKTIGDGVMAVFDDAPAAIDAAVDLQLRFTGEDWPVPIAARMGLHTGLAHPDGGDYHAPAVNRAARVADAAHLGQIVVTSVTAALAERHSFRDLGEHELRGLAPTRLLQVVAPGLRDDFPRRTAGRRVVRLPNPPTSFVGRTAEIAALVALLVEHRLVTIAGVGGCGKTRLAIETAGRLERGYVDGVRFVDLAPVTEDAQVLGAVADALGLFDGAGARDPLDWLAAQIAGRSMLCVLDNCEHVLDASAELVEAVLACAGPSRILTTSREPLAVVGEQVYSVPSLDTHTEALALFEERATEARVGFVVDDASRSTIAEICRRLDGIPLAIELAAAAIGHLSAAQVLERLDDRFRLLTGSRRRVQRQQTLAATLDWSHDLLDADERLVLRRLAVFPASFPLEAAEAVVDAERAVELLGALVAKSLVQVVDDGNRLRYRLLESVRLYAESKLVDAGEAADCRARQRDWVLGWLESMPLEERMLGDVDYLAAEHASIRTALEWSSAQGDAAAVVRIAAGVDWSRSEAWREGARLMQDALTGADALPADLRLQLHVMLWWLGPILPYDLASGARLVEESVGPPTALRAVACVGGGRDLTIAAVVERDDGLAGQAVELAETGVELSERFSAPWQMICRYLAGMAYLSLSDTARADGHFAAGVARSSGEAPYTHLHAALQGYLAITQLLLDHADDALALARKADARVGYERAAVPPYWHHSVWMALPVTLGAVGDETAANRALRAYLDTTGRTDWKRGRQSFLILAGVLAAQRADWPTAARLLGAVRLNIARTPADWILYTTYRDRVRAALGSDRARVLRDEGRAMTTDDAIALALARP